MSELPIKCTLKAGKEFSDPWLTVDANDPADLEFKLKAIIESAGLGLVIEAANALKAANNAAPLLPQGQPAQQAFAPQSAPPTTPAPPHGGWGGQPQTAAPQQQPQQQGFTRPATTHPEGTACEMCNQPLEYKKTSTGKGTWRCPDWRWQNGNPNGHTQLWA